MIKIVLHRELKCHIYKPESILAGELKKLWNIKVKIVPIVIGAFGTITKGLLKGLEDLKVGGPPEY